MGPRTRRSLSVVAALCLVAGFVTACSGPRPTVVESVDALKAALADVDGVSAVSVLEDRPESDLWSLPGGWPRAVGLAQVSLGESWATSIPGVAEAVNAFVADAPSRPNDQLHIVLTTPAGEVGVTESAVETMARVELLRSLGADDGVTGIRIGYPNTRPVAGDDLRFVIELASETGLGDTFMTHESALKAAAAAADDRPILILIDDIPDADAELEGPRGAPPAGGRFFGTLLTVETGQADFAYADGMDATPGVIGWRFYWSNATVLVGSPKEMEATNAALRALDGFTAVDDDGFPMVSSLELFVDGGALQLDSDLMPEDAEYRLAVALSEAGASGVQAYPGRIRVGDEDVATMQRILEEVSGVAPDAGWVLLTTEIGGIAYRDVPIDYVSVMAPVLAEIDQDAYDHISVTEQEGYLVELGRDGDLRAVLSAFYIPAVVDGLPVVVKQLWSGPAVTFTGAETIGRDDLAQWEDYEMSEDLNESVLEIWNEQDLPTPSTP